MNSSIDVTGSNGSNYRIFRTGELMGNVNIGRGEMRYFLIITTEK